MSSQQICSIMEKEIIKHYSNAIIKSLPVADGGEGSVDSFLTARGGDKISLEVTGPHFEKIESFYGIFDNAKAIIEMASCAGLPLVKDKKRPDLTTTYGVGELILDAAQKGCKEIIVGLGGSATNDGGAGAAAAVGVRFINRQGKSFIPTGGTLSQIDSIDFSQKNPLLKDVDIVTMCDIDNPLLGKNGAATIFAPQKGADVPMVELLENEMNHFAKVVKEYLGNDFEELPGSGAAGGMGFGMVSFFNSTLKMGIEVVLDTLKFDELLDGASMVLTGEGKIDLQSLRGKAVIGIAKRTQKFGVPLVAIVGDIGDSIEEAYSAGIWGIFSINRVAKNFSEVIDRAPRDMALTVDNLLGFLKRMGF